MGHLEARTQLISAGPTGRPEVSKVGVIDGLLVRPARMMNDDDAHAPTASPRWIDELGSGGHVFGRPLEREASSHLHELARIARRGGPTTLIGQRLS